MKWWARGIHIDNTKGTYGLYLVPMRRRNEIAGNPGLGCPCKECTNKFFYRLRTKVVF